MTLLAIIGFITICLFAVLTTVLTVQMMFAAMWDSAYSVFALFFGVITVGILMLAWHLSPFTITIGTL
jgi:hypothetical protein